jgi:hypothetical protein
MVERRYQLLSSRLQRRAAGWAVPRLKGDTGTKEYKGLKGHRTKEQGLKVSITGSQGIQGLKRRQNQRTSKG